MKQYLLICYVFLLCFFSLPIYSVDSQKITISSGTSKDAAKKQNAGALTQWFKQLITSKDVLGIVFIAAIFKYIMDAKAAQKDLDSTNKKLDEVEKRGFENKDHLDAIQKSQLELTQLLAAIQEKIETIDQNTELLKTAVITLQKTAQVTQKNTKELQETTTNMSKFIGTISQQVNFIQKHLTDARTNLATTLLEIENIKELDKAQKELLTNLSSVIQNNAIEISTLRKDITSLNQHHEKTETGLQSVENKLLETEEKVQNTHAQGEIIKGRLEEEYSKFKQEQLALHISLTEVQDVVSSIYNTIKNNQ